MRFYPFKTIAIKEVINDILLGKHIEEGWTLATDKWI